MRVRSVFEADGIMLTDGRENIEHLKSHFSFVLSNKESLKPKSGRTNKTMKWLKPEGWSV